MSASATPRNQHRIRRSTIALTVAFAACFMLYLWVRPDPSPAISTGPTAVVTSSTTVP